MTTDAVAAALTEFPELHRLIGLCDAGWQFVPTVVDGEVVEVKGVYVWPPACWTDAITVRDTADAGALRLDADGYIVWHNEGGLVDVVDSLITLPPPSARLSPRLAIARGPVLWTPTSTTQERGPAL